MVVLLNSKGQNKHVAAKFIVSPRRITRRVIAWLMRKSIVSGKAKEVLANC